MVVKFFAEQQTKGILGWSEVDRSLGLFRFELSLPLIGTTIRIFLRYEPELLIEFPVFVDVLAIDGNEHHGIGMDSDDASDG